MARVRISILFSLHDFCISGGFVSRQYLIVAKESMPLLGHLLNRTSSPTLRKTNNLASFSVVFYFMRHSRVVEKKRDKDLGIISFG